MFDMPGFWSSPVLIAASIYVLMQLRHKEASPEQG
jgi:hypothetical protein